jgi:integrase/recombinase XerD
MSSLRESMAEYLAVRRALGYQLDGTERLLRQFLDHLDATGADQITVERAVAWAKLPGRGEHWHAMRLGVVRGFARYLHEVDPRVEVPPADVLPDRSRRAVPDLYTDEQIQALMAATSTLRTAHKTATFRTLFGLLLVTGMRIGEAIALDRADFDADLGTLIIRHGKFGKSRELPLHPTTTSELTRYLRRRDRPRPAGPTEALLISTVGTRLWMADVQTAFRRLRAKRGSCCDRLRAGQGCTTAATALLSARCWTHAAPTAIPSRGSQRCPPTSVTWIPARRIGISRPRPS